MPFPKKAYVMRLLRRNALRKGLLGGSPMWRAVWLAQLAFKGWGKISKGGEAPITFTEPIRQGEAWAIVHEPEQSKKGRGEGRKFLVGPKRQAPRANVMTGTALGTVGRRILAAPSAERINQILGTDAVADPPPSRYERRQARAQRKADAKAATKVERAVAKQRNADAKRQGAAEKQARKAEIAEER